MTRDKCGSLMVAVVVSVAAAVAGTPPDVWAAGSNAAEGTSYDVEIWRAQKEQEFLEAEKARIEEDLKVLKTTQPRDNAERERLSRKRGQLLVQWLETKKSIHGQAAELIGIRLRQTEKAAAALGAARGSVHTARQGAQRTLEQTEGWKNDALELALLTDEMRGVLGEEVGDPRTYAAVAQRWSRAVEQIRQNLEQMSRGDRQEQQAEDRLRRKAVLLRYEALINGQLKQIYGQWAEAYRAMLAGREAQQRAQQVQTASDVPEFEAPPAEFSLDVPSAWNVLPGDVAEPRPPIGARPDWERMYFDSPSAPSPTNPSGDDSR